MNRTQTSWLLVAVFAIAFLGQCSGWAQTALPVIPAKDPVAVGTFDRLWITQVTIVRGERVIIETAPYDGSSILAGQTRRAQKAVADDADLQALVPAALATAQKLAGKAVAPFVLTVNAPTPAKPIETTALFTSSDPAKPDVFQIHDTLDTASKDGTVARMVNGLVAYIAIDAGKGATDKRVTDAVAAAQTVLTAAKAEIDKAP